MKTRLAAGNEAGFTLIEVMVAIFILLLGVLGSAQLANTANKLTLNSKQREGATNLAREIIEAARGVDYDTLTPSRALASLEAQPGLGDALSGQPGWQIIRRGTTYTINSVDSNGNFVDRNGNGTPCAWDDARDGTRSSSDASLSTLLCASLATANPALTSGSACTTPLALPCIDANPDDYRRLELSVKWTRDGTTRSVNQSGVIVNPSGGLGPRIVSVSPATQSLTDVGSPTSQAYSVVTGTNATEVNWAVDDRGNTQGTATLTPSSTPPTWTFSYGLGTPGAAGAVLDGTYTLSVQAFDALGIPGDLKTATLTLNRSAPLAPGAVKGGRDDRAATQTELIDLTWGANAERDIIGYHVYRVGSPDVLVCDTTTFTNPLQTSCTDRNGASGTAGLSNPQYYVKALDRAPDNSVREGTATSNFSVGAKDADPVWPNGTSLSGTTTNGVPTLSWNNAATDPNNGNGAPLFYRIYRDGGNPPTVADRYDTTDNGTVTVFADKNPGASTVHRYWLTAVSRNYQEGPLLGPVTTP